MLNFDWLGLCSIEKGLIEHLENLKAEKAKREAEKALERTMSIDKEAPSSSKQGSSRTLKAESGVNFKTKVNDLKELTVNQRKHSTRSAASAKMVDGPSNPNSSVGSNGHMNNNVQASTSQNSTVGDIIEPIPLNHLKKDGYKLENLKNDSGFSESTSNGTPTAKINGTLKSSLADVKDEKKKSKLTDIESIA